MKIEDINFPVYRCYKNRKTYFKIIHPRLFEEIQLIGSKKIIKQTEAKLYPENLFVRDLILNYAERAEAIDASEYTKIKGDNK